MLEVIGKVEYPKFQGVNVQKCLQSASVSLGVPAERLKYTILEEERGIFKKYAIISIDEVEGLNDKNILEKNTDYEINGTIEIVNGSIIIKNPKGDGKPALISAENNITLTVNGEKIISRTIVYEESTIEVIFKEEEAKRYMNLRITPDKMEAYISIIYKPSATCKLKDVEPSNSVLLEIEVKEEIMPPKFTELEIKNELQNHSIKYGILKMSIIKCEKANEISEMIIANGKKTIETVDDRLDIQYNVATKSKNQNNDGAIDYKDIGFVEGVEKGQVLAVLHPGKRGEDGIDIMGKTIIAKNIKKILLGVGEGCEIVDECTVVATSKGRPSSRGNTFFVYKNYEVNGDVELKTGNIEFVGDIIVSGSVHEGMKVVAGNSILVKNNVSEAEITASGDVVVRGNVINSRIAAGKEDISTLEYLTELKSMKNDLTKLISCVKQLKEMNHIGKNATDGELVKILMETKFKKLPQTSIKVAKRILQQQNIDDKLVFIIRNKILDVGTLNIKNYWELNDAVTIIDNKISVLMMNLTVPVDVVIDYCQDSTIKSSGNIILTGKGEYVSKMVASNSIIFKNDKSLARGGVMKAGKEIRCKIVGGMGGVSTVLMVEDHGQIWAEIAYTNTRFIIGDREYVLNAPSKNIHAYLNDARELTVDKLQL